MIGNSGGKPRNTGFSFYLRTGRITVPARKSGVIETKFNPWHDPEDGRFTTAGNGGFSGGGRSASKVTARMAKPSRNGGSFGGAGAGGSWSNANDQKPFGGGGGSFGGGGASGSWDAPPPSPGLQDSGGSFGGGGASGSWEGPEASPTKTETNGAKPSAKVRTVESAAIVAASSANGGTSDDVKRETIEKNGYIFETDQIGNKRRTRKVEAQLELSETAKRSQSAQAAAGGEDRLSDDDGGHFIAARFNGPKDWFNHFAQNSNFNRGAYRDLENGWATELKAGRKVFVDIVPHYRGTSIRPDSLTVVWFVDGRKNKKFFRNARKGK